MNPIVLSLSSYVFRDICEISMISVISVKFLWIQKPFFYDLFFLSWARFSELERSSYVFRGHKNDFVFCFWFSKNYTKQYLWFNCFIFNAFRGSFSWYKSIFNFFWLIWWTIVWTKNFNISRKFCRTKTNWLYIYYLPLYK